MSGGRAMLARLGLDALAGEQPGIGHMPEWGGIAHVQAYTIGGDHALGAVVRTRQSQQDGIISVPRL